MPLALRRLSDLDIRRGYLPLRYETLFREKAWTRHAVATPDELLDRFDDDATAFGIYDDTKLLAAIRLIVAESPEVLPSGSYIPLGQFCGTCGEISKALVTPSARQCGLFTALMLRCFDEACDQDLSHVFISVIDSEKARMYFQGEGFRLVGTPFQFKDHLISPKERAIVLRRSPLDSPSERNSVMNRLKQVVEDASDRLAKPGAVRAPFPASAVDINPH